MDEQVINDLFERAVSSGYRKNRQDFIKLLYSDKEVFDDNFQYVQSQGYQKSPADFEILIGKKKVGTGSFGGGTSSATPKTAVAKPTPVAEPEEQDYFTGAFGNVLRGFDNIVPLGIGDFVDDMARSVAAGYRQGKVAEEADRLLLKGTKATPEQIQKFIDARKNAQQLGASAEMRDYQKTYESEGKGFWGVVKGLAKNPSIIPEVLSSSLTAMATNTDALKAGAAAVGTGTTYGAATGAAAGGVGAAPGAVAGAVASLPYAFGLASSVVEAGSTFGDLLQEELNGKELTKENVKAILEDQNKLSSIRNKAIARGIVIGTVDALTGKLASGVGAKVLQKSAAKSATGVATKAGTARAVGAGAAVEALGGSGGEAAARAVTGQEMDVSEIALEGLAELPGGIRSTIQARLAKPSYKVNGENVSEDQIDDLILTMDPVDLAKTNIEIKNDFKGRQKMIQDKIVTHAIREQVKQANPDLDENTTEELVKLESELKKFEGNTTQSGKDKAAAIRSQIKTLQENAIQKQAAGEVPVQPTPGVSEEVEGGKPQPKPEVVTEEGVKETITPQVKKEKVNVLFNFEGNPIENKEQVDAINAVIEERIPKLEGLGAAPKMLQDLGIKVSDEAQESFNKFVQDKIDGKTKETFSEWVKKSETPAELPKVTQVKVAPFFNTTIANKEEAATLRKSPEYQNYVQSLLGIAKQIGVPAKVVETIGGYENQKGERIVEISNSVDLENATMEQAEEFAALAATLAPEVQEASIAAQYTDQGAKNHNANEYSIKVSDVDGAIEALKKVGITDFSIDENTGEVSFIDVLDFTDPELQQNIGNFLLELNEKGIKYEQKVYKPLDSRRIGKGARKKVLGRIKSAGPRPIEGGQDILSTIEEAIKRDAEFQGVEVEKYFEPRPGNRLFNEPIPEVSEIADRYFQRVLKSKRPKYFGSRSIDEARAKRISDAFDAMENAPTNPEVKEAYEALAKETLEQYKDMLDAGYKVEINNNEPYNNSQEMIDDLRNNKRMKIFSTESGFGDSKITDEQRDQNPLLRDSGFKDVNGKPLLVNDVFRAIHDFFGHSELGNSFGPKGEENAWNVHARMFSPLARKAMTTETRGQNSYVNFSGVNDKINELREQARALREEGLYSQARRKVEQIYEQMSFADQKVGLLPEEFYQIDETDIGDVELQPKVEAMEEISQELTEADLPGYDRMMSELEGVIKKSENRGVPFNKIMDNAMEYMQQSKAYENATDVQREALVRDIRSRFKKREKRAPSVKKVLGQEKTMVTVDDYKMMVNQIKMEARAAREAKADLNTKRKQLADVIRKMATEGKISVNRVAALVNKIGKLNLDSQTAVDKFVDYAGKVFADAEYANKLNIANTTRKQLKSLAKNKDKAANLRDLAKKFGEIDPSMVEDIDEYNRVASLIKESVKGSTTRGSDVKFANMVKESAAMEYIKTTMEQQKKKLFDMKVAEVQELLGVDASQLTYEQLVEMIDKEGPITKDNEKLVRSAIDKAFNLYSTIIKESIRTGKDPFTGEDVEYTPNQKRVVKEFMSMDLNLLTPKQALEAVDALMNFFQNQSVAKMGSVFAKYMGEYEMNRMKNKGAKGKPISKYWSKGLGRLLVEQTANLNILFEREFGGSKAGGNMMDAMGVTDAINGKAAAQAEANKTVDEYVNKFFKAKPNGQEFNTAYNNVERWMAGAMMRNVIGTEAEMQAEFDRRKNLILKVEPDGTRTGTIPELEKGNEQEREKAKVYQEVFDKVVADSKNAKDIESKIDKTNMEAINFWREKFAEKYDELADVALGIYNKVLDKDINYLPDFLKKLSSDTGKVELANDDMAFLFNSGNAPLYKKETGILMEATRPEKLPTDDNGRTNRYFDFSDNNIANAFYDALVDIKTAAPIRQMDAALKSDAFREIASNTDDRKLIENRIKLFVNNVRKKNPFSDDEFSKAVKNLNRFTNIAVGQALGGFTQPIKQSIPIALNTLVNAGDLDIASIIDESKQNFINNSGYAIANRGAESQAQIKSLSKLLEEVAKTKGEKTLRGIENLNKLWLKYTLVKFDLAVARASWMTYYQQDLKKQGIDPESIDWNTHEVNKQAADYAQRQVDRQQNVSDTDLAGALLSSKDAAKQIGVKIIMPFASFRMNQSARIGADIATLTNKMATEEDKKIAARSLAGTAVETATFRAISIGVSLLIAKAIKIVMGRDDDEEKDQKKKDAILKGQLTSTVADVLSPAPILDKVVQLGVSNVLETTQDALKIPKDNQVAIYSGNQQDIFQQLGLLGISGARIYQIIEMAKLSTGGSFEDNYGRKRYLSQEDQETIAKLIPFAVLSNIGLAPAELNSVVRGALTDAKRAGSTKEGGKTREDVEEEKRKEEGAAERKGKIEESRKEKVEALEEMKSSEIDQEKIDIIDELIDENSMTEEERKQSRQQRSRENAERKEFEKSLLGGYDNKSDLKKYDPNLYEENFGRSSEYYERYGAEDEVKREMNKVVTKKEEEEMGYAPKKRSKYGGRTTIRSSYRRTYGND